MNQINVKSTSSTGATGSIKSLFGQHRAVNSTYPFVVVATFVPPGVPETHTFREMHDDRAYTDGAPAGYWDVNVWDIENDHMPMGRSAFVLTTNGVVCDRLAVESEYRGQGLGSLMLDTGARLCGDRVFNAEAFTDADETFWCSEISD